MKAGRLRPLSGMVLLAGAVVLIVSLLASWYAVLGDFGSAGRATETFSPSGAMITSSWYPSSSESYAGAGLPSTGALMSVATVLVVAGALAGALGGFLMVSRWRPVRPWSLLVLPWVAVVLAVAAPAFLATGLPMAVCSDSQGFSPPFGAYASSTGRAGDCPWSWEFDLGGGVWYGSGQSTGPGDSFWGHSASNGTSLEWGPALGWFVSLAGAAVLIAGTLGAGYSLSAESRRAAIPPPITTSRVASRI